MSGKRPKSSIENESGPEFRTLYHAMLEQAADAIFLHDFRGKFIEVNQRACESLGYTRKELLKMSVTDVELDFDLEKAQAAWSGIKPGARNILFGHQKRKDGTVFPVEVHFGSADWKGSRLFLGIVRDISDRVEIETELQKSEERLRLSTEMAGVAVWEYDFLAGEMNRSRNHDLLYGLNWQERWDISTFLDAIHEEDREYSNRMIQGAVEPGGPDHYNFDFRVVYPDKSIHWLHVIGQVVERNAEGRGIIVRGCLQDITERRQATDAIRFSEEKFNKAFQNTPDAITITRASDGVLLDVNDAVLRMAGYDRDAIIGKPSVLLKFWQNPEDRNRYESILREQGSVRDFEAKFLTKAGEVRDFYLSAEMFVLNNETCILGVLRDITEQKRILKEIEELNRDLEERVNERTAQLEMANSDLEAFSYSVSHDLKAPLRGIAGYTTLLRDSMPEGLSDENKEFIDNILESTRHMGSLIEDLLKYSHLEITEVRNEKVLIRDLVQSTLDLYKWELKKDGFRLILDVPDLEIFTDSRGISIVLRNLLENAIKFTREKKDPVITVSLQEENSSWILKISDNGIGFDMKYHSKIFDVFQRLNHGKDYPGTGIGLTIARKVVQRMNGKIWAESSPGKGSTFILKIRKI